MNFIEFMDKCAHSASKQLDEYFKLECQIRELTGFSLEQLRDLFAMGYTLKRPDYDLTLTEMAMIIDQYD